MKSLVLVIVPDGVADVEGYVRDAMRPHRRTEAKPGRCDFYVIGGQYDGCVLPPDAPHRHPHTWQNNLCPVRDITVVPAAIVDAEGEWHSSQQFGVTLDAWMGRPHEAAAHYARWEAYARNLLARDGEASVVGVTAHS